MKPVQGMGAAGIDLRPADRRYSLHVELSTSRRQVVLFCTQIAKKGIAGPLYEIEGPEDAFHEYQLIFDPNRSARLLVDGVERLRDYRGHREYVEGWEFDFDTAVYKSEQSEAVFKRVRFEINWDGRYHVKILRAGPTPSAVEIDSVKAFVLSITSLPRREGLFTCFD